MRSKGQVSLNFSYNVNFKDFYTKLCVCSHKYIEHNFHFVAGVMPQGWDLGVKNFSVGMCDGAPSTARSS